MNGLAVALTAFSITAWILFNFSFTSNLSGVLFHTRQDLFVAILILSILTNLICFIYLISLYRASVTDPGRIPDSPPWNQVQKENGSALESKKSGGPRFCRYERKYKPDRAHHCSQYDTRLSYIFIPQMPTMYTSNGPSLSLARQLRGLLEL